MNSKSKIFVYADSLSCVECDMKFEEWKLKIRELKIRNIDTKIFFLLNSNYYQIVKQIMDRELFDIPIFFESDKYFIKANNLPLNIKRSTLVLDNDNKIVLIGDPLYSDNMWELYKKTISGSE